MATQKAHFLEGKKIIVSGAGIAGLAFVVAFGKHWDPSLKAPEIVIYERDQKEATANREGYSLSLNGVDKDGGLVALQQLGLLDEILKHAILGLESTGGGSFKVWASDWSEMLAIRFRPYKGLPTSGIRIARRDLRDVLIVAAEEVATIRWETSCTAAEKFDSGRIRVRVSGGGADAGAQDDECDLLIAADGAHSKIRASLRPDDRLTYAGAVQIGGSARFPEGIPPPLAENWGLILSGQGVCCFFSPVDKEKVVWALSRLEDVPRDVPKERTLEQFRSLMDETLDLGHMFAEPFATIVRRTDMATSLCIPARDKEPFYHNDDDDDEASGTAGGVVFIGDSNHAVSPFAGNGANMALKDGWDLAEQLCGSDTLRQAVVRYDKISCPRAWQTLKTSHQRIAMGHSTGLRYLCTRIYFAIGAFMIWLLGK